MRTSTRFATTSATIFPIDARRISDPARMGLPASGGEMPVMLEIDLHF